MSELDLFSLPPTQTSLDEGYFVEYRPISVLTDSGPIEFHIPGEGSNYIDFSNTFLYVRASVVKEDGSNLDADSNVAPVCNFLHSLWSQCDLFLNGSLVTASTNTYPYRSYLETLLSFGKDAKQSQLTSNLWVKDTSGFFDATNRNNKGYQARKNIAAESKQFDMIGKLHLDFSCQNRYLVNGVEVKLRLIRSKDNFCLQGGAGFENSKVSLKEVSLFCRKVKPSDAILLAHAKALETGPIQYPLRRVEVKTFTVTQGSMSCSKENLFLGQLPKRLIFCCLGNDAFNGRFEKNPFNFEPNNINYVALLKNGKPIPGKAYEPNFAQDLYIRSYLALFTNTSQYFDDTGNDISRQDFKSGYTIFCFDLTPQLNSSGTSFELIKQGNLRLEIHFSSALTQTLTILVYAEFDNLLQIDRSRNIVFDYSA